MVVPKDDKNVLKSEDYAVIIVECYSRRKWLQRGGICPLVRRSIVSPFLFSLLIKTTQILNR